MEEPNSLPPARTETRPPALRDPATDKPMAMTPLRGAMRSPTARDVLALIFRHRTLIGASFLAIFLGVVIGTWMLPMQYQASMKILVKRERVDPVVTPVSNVQAAAGDVSLEDLNTEVELLKSRDLLEKVVVSCGLDTIKDDSFLNRILSYCGIGERSSSGPGTRIPRAVGALANNLTVEPITRSKMIDIRYQGGEPQLAAKVLQTLASLYLEKHLAVHRPPGALDFFSKQADQYRRELAAAEQQMAEFRRTEGVVSVEIEKDLTLRKLSDFEAQLRESQAAEAAVGQRIKSLEAQVAATPARVTTEVRTSDNPYLLQQLKSTLLNLGLKRTELLTKYEPGYRTVQEVDTQIAQTQEALRQAEQSALRDEVTGLDKTRQWLDEELARARSESATVKARSIEIAKSLGAYRDSARQINRREVQHADLARTVKTAEENYLLYQHKQEEARISDELDRRRIVNVSIAEAATVPAQSSSPNWRLSLVAGGILALLGSFGLAFMVDRLDPCFRTPDEVQDFLGVPVIASLPRN